MSAPFAFPAWTITTLTAFYLTFPPLLSILSHLSSRQLNALIIVLFFSQLLPSLLFFNAGCEIINDLLCRHPLPRFLSLQIQGNNFSDCVDRLPVFVMGMAAGLIRQRCDEETNLLQPIQNCHQRHLRFQDIFNFKKDDRVDCKTRVDFCSLLIVSVPFFSLVLPNPPYLPRISLLANVLFVLPQLIVITGFTSFKPSFCLSLYGQDSPTTKGTR